MALALWLSAVLIGAGIGIGVGFLWGISMATKRLTRQIASGYVPPEVGDAAWQALDRRQERRDP